MPVNQLTTHTYDRAGRLVRIYNGHALNFALFNGLFEYTYDNVGNRTRLFDQSNSYASATVTWTYDKTYQLTGEKRDADNPYDFTFAYDPVGNRLQEINNTSGEITTSTYDVANQLQTSENAAGTTNYVYDGAGNLRTATDPTGGISTNTWDDDNRRVVAQKPAGVINTLVYSGDGLRFAKQDSTGTINFVWDGQNYLREEGTGISNVLYTQTPDVYGLLIAGRYLDFDLSSHYFFDALGSTTCLTFGGSALSILAQYVYRAFGDSEKVAGEPDFDPVFRWVGQLGYYHDKELGGYNLRRRDYQIVLARFLSRDPLGFEAGDTNPYRYVWNSPVKAVDPSGMIAPLIVVCGTACLGCGACLGPGVVGCWNTDTWKEFYDCYKYYLNILPSWHKWCCGAACGGCLTCVAKWFASKPKPPKPKTCYCSPAVIGSGGPTDYCYLTDKNSVLCICVYRCVESGTISLPGFWV